MLITATPTMCAHCGEWTLNGQLCPRCAELHAELIVRIHALRRLYLWYLWTMRKV